MKKLATLRRRIAAIFENEKTPLCLWFSGGSDSRLLLEVMLEHKQPFGILRFEDGLDREQKLQIDTVIMRHNLQVFSYPAVSHALVGENGEMAMVSQYAIDLPGKTALLARDLVEDTTRCAFDIKLEIAQTRSAPIVFETHVWGSRNSDTHWITEFKPVIKDERWKHGDKQFIAPLYDWTAGEVMQGLLEFPEVMRGRDTGDIACCSRCLQEQDTKLVFCPKAGKEIPVVDWDRKENLIFLRRTLQQG